MNDNLEVGDIVNHDGFVGVIHSISDLWVRIVKETEEKIVHRSSTIVPVVAPALDDPNEGVLIPAPEPAGATVTVPVGTAEPADTAAEVEAK